MHKNSELGKIYKGWDENGTFKLTHAHIPILAYNARIILSED